MQKRILTILAIVSLLTMVACSAQNDKKIVSVQNEESAQSREEDKSAYSVLKNYIKENGNITETINGGYREGLGYLFWTLDIGYDDVKKDICFTYTTYNSQSTLGVEKKSVKDITQRTKIWINYHSDVSPVEITFYSQDHTYYGTAFIDKRINMVEKVLTDEKIIDEENYLDGDYMYELAKGSMSTDVLVAMKRVDELLLSKKTGISLSKLGYKTYLE